MLATLKPYLFPLVLLFSILLGAFTGYYLGDTAILLKPIGNVFLNLILTAIVPLVFFSVASSVEKMLSSKQLTKMFSSMAITFIFCSIVASVFMIVVVLIYPPIADVSFRINMPGHLTDINVPEQIVGMFSVANFGKLFTHENMLPLILFSILVGTATARSETFGKTFSRFLQAGNEIFTNIINIIMYIAPIGFFAFFAVLVAEMGPKLLTTYFHVMLIYYIAGLFYFFAILSLYAYVAGNTVGFKSYWKYINVPALTSLATCSSAASLATMMQASRKMGVPSYIYESVLPLGTFLHKQGTILGAILKIAFLLSLFHMSFTGVGTFATAIVISILVGTVMGAIPSGGMLGELLILSFYGFPSQSLLIIAAISIIIDPLATMLNVAGNTVCSMLVARIIDGKDWFTIPAGSYQAIEENTNSISPQ